MKNFSWVMAVTTLALAGCAGDSSKKNTDSASKRTPVAETRCPPGTLRDETTRQCVDPDAQAQRSGPIRDTLGRGMGGLSEMSLPSGGGLLGR